MPPKPPLSYQVRCCHSSNFNRRSYRADLVMSTSKNMVQLLYRCVLVGIAAAAAASIDSSQLQSCVPPNRRMNCPDNATHPAVIGEAGCRCTSTSVSNKTVPHPTQPGPTWWCPYAELAWQFANHIQPWRSPHLEVFDALQLGSLCGSNRPPPPQQQQPEQQQEQQQQQPLLSMAMAMTVQ